MLKIMKRFTVLSLLLWGALSVQAQQDAGIISGTVFDPTHAVLPGASVTLTNPGTGLTRSVTTGTQGEFVFTPLQVGVYQITVDAKGFASEVQENLLLEIQQKLNVEINLKVGAASEKVVVESGQPALQTEDSSLGQVIDTQKVADLPLNGRNVYQFVTLTPGVALDPNGRAAISGQSSQNQFYALDGVDNNNYSGTLASGQAYTISPSPDAIEEFKVQTNNYSAEFGQSAGGVVNVITKSGTNSFHGTVSEFVRNQALDGTNYFATIKPAYQQNQFGGTLGGPVIIPRLFNGRDKLFFFMDYEGFRSNTGETQQLVLPPSAWYTGNFSSYLTGTTYQDTCTGATYDTGQLFDPTSAHTVTCMGGTMATVRNPISYNGQANVINPALISAAATNTLALLPKANGSQGGTPVYIGSPVNEYNYNRGDVKVDFQSSHDHIFGRYGITDQPPSGVPAFPGPASPGTYGVQRQQGVAVGDSHIFSQNVVNEARYAWSHNDASGFLYSTALNAATVGYGGIPYQPGLLGGLPTLSFSDISSSYGSSSWNPTLSEARDNQISDVLNLVRGVHTFKMGGAFNHYSWLQYQSPNPLGYYTFTGQLSNSPTIPGSVTSGAAVNGSGFAEFLYGLSNNNGLSTGITSDNWRSAGSVFIQDDWKATPKLTVNLGLRWEFGTGLHETEDRLGGIDLKTGAFELPKSRQGKTPSLPAGLPVEYVDSDTLMNPRQKNFGPRVGFAYKIDSKTVIRGAAGIFYANPFIAGTLGYPLNPPFGITTYNHTTFNIATGFPSTFLSNFDPTTLQFYLFEPKPDPPSTINWNVAVERDLPWNTSLEVSYAGSHSIHVNAGYDVNQPYPTTDGSIPVSQRRPYPDLGVMAVVANEANGNYSSLQTKFQKRYSNGLTFLLAYTWAHSLDDAPSAITLEFNNTAGAEYDFYRDPRNRRLDYGNSYFDIRHRLAYNSLYNLPIGKGQLVGGHMPGWADEIAGGWRLGGIVQYQTGHHFSAATYNDPSNADEYAYSGTAYPNVIGKIYDYSSCPGGHKSINCWFNPTAFGPSNPGQYGNETRNSLVGPSEFLLDFSVGKTFPIHEKTNIQFRGEFFNLPNHPNFALPTNLVEAGNFGQITSAIATPRQIQFALRLEF
jgi:hypothetical protein